MFRIVLALAAAGVAAEIPGILQLMIAKWLTASGALGVFVVVYFYSPASLVAQPDSGALGPPLSTLDSQTAVPVAGKPSEQAMEVEVQRPARRPQLAPPPDAVDTSDEAADALQPPPARRTTVVPAPRGANHGQASQEPASMNARRSHIGFTAQAPKAPGRGSSRMR